MVKRCIKIAQQAPTASNRQNWHFIVITDQSIKDSLSDLFKKGWQSYIDSPTSVAKNLNSDDPKKNETQKRVYESAKYLVDNLRNVPIFVISCIESEVMVQMFQLDLKVRFGDLLLLQFGVLCLLLGCMDWGPLGLAFIFCLKKSR